VDLGLRGKVAVVTGASTGVQEIRSSEDKKTRIFLDLLISQETVPFLGQFLV
jgi:hypothetical protein